MISFVLESKGVSIKSKEAVLITDFQLLLFSLSVQFKWLFHSSVHVPIEVCSMQYYNSIIHFIHAICCAVRHFLLFLSLVFFSILQFSFFFGWPCYCSSHLIHLTSSSGKVPCIFLLRVHICALNLFFTFATEDVPKCTWF